MTATEGNVRVRLDKVSRWYGSVLGLSRVDLELGPGVTALLGPNGAGKSTLIRLVSGLLRPSSGRVLLLGQPPFANPTVLDRLGLVPEETDLRPAPRTTVLEWLVYLLELDGADKATARERARKSLEDTGLAEASSRRVGTLSRGMTQRLRLAQAIANEPEVLVLDEPLTGLDPIGRSEMIERIRAVGDRGTTVIVSSHILHEVELMTRNVVLMAEGRLLASGNVHEIRALIDAHPHRVSIVTPEPRQLAQKLLETEYIQSIELRSDRRRVELETRDREGLYTFIEKLVLDGETVVDEMTSPDDNLESVFRYLVG